MSRTVFGRRGPERAATRTQEPPWLSSLRSICRLQRPSKRHRRRGGGTRQRGRKKDATRPDPHRRPASHYAQPLELSSDPTDANSDLADATRGYPRDSADEANSLNQIAFQIALSVKSELQQGRDTGRWTTMGEVHQLILREGLESARSRADTRAERQAVEAAGMILAEEVSRLGITHAGFAMTSLPHKRIEGPLWRRQGHRTTLLVESDRTGKGGWVGVPYGSMARLILLYLQTEAVRSNDPEVELGRSMHAWLSRMGIPAGGKNYKLVGEQARRISACRLTFLTEIPGAELRQNGAFVQNAITLTAATDERHERSGRTVCALMTASGARSGNILSLSVRRLSGPSGRVP